LSPVADKIQEFYDKNVQNEWERLDRHRTEFEVTMKALREFLPPSPCRVLDVGGGPGRYSIALAKSGYAVTLFDLSKGCLDFAERKSSELGVELSGTVKGSSLDLGKFADEAFDVVLLMGPLYHLLKREREATGSLREQTGTKIRRHSLCHYYHSLRSNSLVCLPGPGPTPEAILSSSEP